MDKNKNTSGLSKQLKEYSSIDYYKVLDELNVSNNGLAEHEAKKRLELYGHNLLTDKKEKHIILRYIMQSVNPLIGILFVAAMISFFTGGHIDGIIIISMILISMIMGFVQTYSTEKALKELKEAVKTTATVIRDGKEKEINAHEICIGDIIFLNSGDVVPADARIIDSKDFFVNQSSITGESVPCAKNEKKILTKEESALSDLSNMVFLGSNVVSGTAKAVVVKTGKNTEYGMIAEKLSEAPQKSQFEKGVTSFGYFITKVIIVLVLFIFLFNAIMKNNVLEAFLFAIAIAVGVTPELLPMIMSITMANGAKNMAKHGVLVKKLSAIPNFGSMDVLCTDKTGTLTENNIKLVTYTDIYGSHSKDVLFFTYLNSFHQTGIKNPLDDAVLNFKKLDVKGCVKIDEVPFDFVRKRVSIVVKVKGQEYIVTKGAPEEIFKCCKTYRAKNKAMPFGLNIRQKAIDEYHKFSSDGYRVLAVAIKKINTKKKSFEKSDEEKMEFLGFVSFLDPPRKDVKEVLIELKEMGVDVKVITGDNELIAKKICDEIGLPVKGILKGQEVHSMSDDALKAKVESITIFARFSPYEKNRVIQALQAKGHVVGYMGDGVNDAPSLKTADVGISVNNAVDVAKDSAEIVLTQKSLLVLKNGIIEGRKTFGNTIKYIMMGLSSSFGNMFSAVGAILFLPFLPMLPVQILLNNLMYDFSQITIPSDKVDKEWISKPRKWNIKFIKHFMYVFGPISSIFDFLTFFVLYAIFKVSAPQFQTGWFIESLATQTLVIHVIRTRGSSFFTSPASALLIVSTIGIVILGWILPFTPIGEFFKFEPLSVSIMITLAGLVMIYLLIVEVAKRIFYKYYDF